MEIRVINLLLGPLASLEDTYLLGEGAESKYQLLSQFARRGSKCLSCKRTQTASRPVPMER